MKDNFDLRSFLTENKLTENSRGEEGRYHFDGSQNNSGRVRTLVEMKMPADPDTSLEDNFNDSMDECGDTGFESDLLEAGYTDGDDDLEFGDSEDDITLQRLLSTDKKGAKARKAAERDIDLGGDSSDDVPGDAPVVPDDDADTDPQGDSDPNAAAEAGISSGLRYNPDLVEFTMSTAELDQYLSGFRRPNVAVNFLNRALKAAQTEVNDMNTADSDEGPIKTSHLYLVLGADGYYHTSAFKDSCKEEDDSGKARRIPVKMCIAKVSGDPNYKSWED